MKMQQKKRKLIVTFTHSNYLIQASGTEKFIRTLSKILIDNEYHHLVLFSIKTEILFKTVGVIFDDKFEGIFRYGSLLEIIENYSYTKDCPVSGVMIQHLRDHDLNVVAQCINQLCVSSFFFVHDLYSICPSETMVNSDGEFCEKDYPSDECGKCNYKKNAITHYREMASFLKSIESNLSNVICPSPFLRKKWSNAFPNYTDITIVRPHNLLSGFQAYESVILPINLAFCGAQLRNKGFEKWEELCEHLKVDPRYRLFYLGKGSKKTPGVTDVYVNNATQGNDAMQDAIRENNIACALVWPLCPETYSFVYDEMSINGVYIVTNSISGNIAAQIMERGNGVVLERNDDVLAFFQDDEIITSINNYRKSGLFHPNRCVENRSLEFLYANEGNMAAIEHKPKRIHRSILTVVYKMKCRLKK